ncbi:hypothetical protein D9M70_500790 [compost metagenome]
MQLVMDRVPRGLALVSLSVAVPTGGHDVALGVAAAVNPGLQMFGSALKVSSLATGEIEGRSERLHGSLPHWTVAIEAKAGLATEGVSAQTRESQGHERSRSGRFRKHRNPLALRGHIRGPAK